MNFIKSYKHYLIAFLLFAVVKLFLPAANGLTAVGVNVVSVLLPVLYLWITVSTDWVSLLALAGLIMSGVLTPVQVYQQSMGHTVIITIIVCMALNACLTATGVTHKIATWFITRKFIKNRPYVFISMFFLSCLVLGLFMETMTLTIIFITLAQAICEDLGYKKGDPFYTVLMMGILWHGSVSTSATPIAHALPLILIGSAESSLGITISFAQWMSIGLPYAAIMFVLSISIVRFVWKPDTEKFKNYDIEAMKKKTQPLTLEGKITAGLFLAVVAAWLYPELFKTVTPAFAGMLSRFGTTVPAILAIALLCIIRVGGKPLGEFPKMVQGAPMGVLIFTGTVCVLGTAVSSPDTGISLFLQNTLSPVTQGMPAIVIIGFALIGALILTNFISNTVAMLLFVSVSVPLLADSGVNLPAFIILVGLMACFGVLTPAASVTTPLFFGPEYVKTGNTVKYNLAMILMTFLCTIIILWPLASVLL